MGSPTAAIRPRLPKAGKVRVLDVGTTGIILDVDGIKASIASSASDVIYTGYHFGGTTKVVSGEDYGYSRTPQFVSITTPADAAIDAVDVVVTGYNLAGALVTDTITLTDGGGVTDDGTVEFLKVTRVQIPAQSGVAAGMTIGFEDDDDGIKESFSSSAAAQDFSDTDFDGVQVSSDDYALAEPPRNVALKTSTHADIDAVAVKIYGLDAKGVRVTDTITLTNGGNATDQGVVCFSRVDRVEIPAQSGVGGALEIGWGSIASFEEFEGQYVEIVCDQAFGILCDEPGTAITAPDVAATGDGTDASKCMSFPASTPKQWYVDPDRSAFKVDAAAIGILRFTGA